MRCVWKLLKNNKELETKGKNEEGLEGEDKEDGEEQWK